MMRENSTAVGCSASAGDGRQGLQEAVPGAEAAGQQLEGVVELIGEGALAPADEHPEVHADQHRRQPGEQQPEDHPAEEPTGGPGDHRCDGDEQDHLLQRHGDPGALQQRRQLLVPAAPAQQPRDEGGRCIRSLGERPADRGAPGTASVQGQPDRPRRDQHVAEADQRGDQGAHPSGQRPGEVAAHRNPCGAGTAKTRGDTVMPRSANLSVNLGRMPVGNGLPRKRPLASTPAE